MSAGDTGGLRRLARGGGTGDPSEVIRNLLKALGNSVQTNPGSAAIARAVSAEARRWLEIPGPHDMPLFDGPTRTAEEAIEILRARRSALIEKAIPVAHEIADLGGGLFGFPTGRPFTTMQVAKIMAHRGMFTEEEWSMPMNWLGAMTKHEGWRRFSRVPGAGRIEGWPARNVHAAPRALWEARGGEGV